MFKDMYDLKSIQKKLLIASTIVFILSVVTMVYFATQNPVGYISDKLGVVPITTITNTAVKQYNYKDKITIKEEQKIKTTEVVLVSTSLTTTFTDATNLKIEGIAYVEPTTKINIELPKNIIVSLTKGEFIVDTESMKIYVLSGQAYKGDKKIADINQTATYLVDAFKATSTDTNDFVIDSDYRNLIALLKKINLLPAQLTNLSLNTTGIVQVGDTQDTDPDLSVGCESSLLNQQLLCDINKYRVTNNLNKITLDETLNTLTLSHVVWMNDNQSTSTLESNGLSYIERCENVGIECIAEINLKIDSNYSESDILNQVIKNKSVLDKTISLIGMNISGEYLSILLR